MRVPIKLAIIGGGPSAFYAASRLLSLQPLSTAPQIRAHIFDQLWAPHGLVRYGVAPDHPEVKNCTNKFDGMAADPRFRFFGNVHIGEAPGISKIPHARHLPLSSLLSKYTHLLFATGCPVATNHKALPASEYCAPAISLVHWYTRHPSQPSPPPLEKSTHVSVIGMGNVAFDVARMLLCPPELLSTYDVPLPVLEVLSRSSLKHVSIFGRRGPLEVSFTAKELRELLRLPNASLTPIDPVILSPNPETPLTRPQTRILDLLRKGSTQPPGTTPKSWSLDFFRSPIGVSPPQSPSSEAMLTLAHTTLDPKTRRAVSTGSTSTLATSLIVPALGFHDEPSDAFYDPGLGHLRNVSGRLVSESGKVMRNMYASGWAATGAQGVLAATMRNAYDVVDTLLGDHMEQPALQFDETSHLAPSINPHSDDPPSEVLHGLDSRKEDMVVQYADWKKIDLEEIRRGTEIGKERERMDWVEAWSYLKDSKPHC